MEFEETMDGGVITNDSAIVVMSYEISGDGGVKISGRWIVERLRYIPPAVHLNYALAMASSNIYNTTPASENAIINNKTAAPALDANRFVIKQTSVWCDFGDPCPTNNGAFLPSIVKSRQKAYLPPKVR